MAELGTIEVACPLCDDTLPSTVNTRTEPRTADDRARNQLRVTLTADHAPLAEHLERDHANEHGEG